MPAMKVVLQLSDNQERIRQKAVETVSKFTGITNIQIETTGKLTVIGEIDVTVIVMKLRKKVCRTEVVSVGVDRPRGPSSVGAPENNNSVQSRSENGPSPIPVNYQHGYSPAYPNSYYQNPYEPNACVIM